jgi:hypothetical protein
MVYLKSKIRRISHTWPVRADPFSHYSPKEQDPLSFTEIEKKRLNENTIDYSNQNRCANCYT